MNHHILGKYKDTRVRCSPPAVMSHREQGEVVGKQQLSVTLSVTQNSSRLRGPWGREQIQGEVLWLRVNSPRTYGSKLKILAASLSW